MDNLDNPNLWQAVHLAGPVRTADLHVEWPGVPAGMNVLAWSGALMTERGMLHKRDLLQWADVEDCAIGFAIGFARTDSAAANFIVFVHPCQRLSETAWMKTGSIILLNFTAIVGALPYYNNGGNSVVPLLHTV